MSLVSNISDLATRAATEDKALRTLINGNVSDLSSLTTTAKTNLVAAINEVKAAAATVPDASDTVKGIVELATTAETTTGTDTVRAVTPAGVKAAIDALINAAPGTLDTLDELAAALGDDANFASTVTTALAGKQPLDTDLTAIAALVSAANKLPYATGSGTWSLTDLSAFGRTLIDDADAATALTTLGAQPLDTDLTAIAALTSAADKLPYATGAGTWAMATFTAAGRALVDDADATAQRATLSVYSQTEIGDPTTNFVTTFNAGLV